MRSVVVSVCCSMFFCGMVWAQATAQISGTVRDSSGSVVPGAEVKATQTDTGVVRSTTSEADGNYVLPAFPVGPYRLEIAKDGFTKAVQSGIVLQVNTDPASMWRSEWAQGASGSSPRPMRRSWKHAAPVSARSFKSSGSDGIQATSAIRSLTPPTCHATIIGTGSTGPVHGCLEVGIDDFLAKPLTISSLRGVLSSWATRKCEK